jgi:hypothetical protein
VTRDPSTIPDALLERYRLGELPADQAARISERAVAEPDTRERLEALAQSDAAMRDAETSSRLARRVSERLTRGREWPVPAWGWRAWAGAAGAAAVLVVTLSGAGAGWRFWPLSTDGPDQGSTAPDRIKGDSAALLLFRKAGASSDRLTDGAAARPGDLVRVGYRASNALFGVIVSIDGRGAVTRHLPVEGASAIPLQPGEPVPLPDAFELDDAPRWERFFLITSETTFDVEPVVAAARRAAADAAGGARDAPATLPLPAGFDQTSFLLRKIP